MGALHGGHRSNIRRAAAECDVVAVSIFVNPLQFGPNEDLDVVPKGPGQRLCPSGGGGRRYRPGPPDRRDVPRGAAGYGPCKAVGRRPRGAHRPGHFDGVATIVTKLFGLSGPCYAYFGEKDYQQLVIVRRLVADLSLPGGRGACSTVREPDGLALSSRNAYLTPTERAAAPGPLLVPAGGQTRRGGARA